MAIKWELPWGNSNFWESLLATKPITIFFVYLTTKVALSKKAGSWNVYFWPFLPSTSRHKSCKVLGRWFLGFQLRGLFTIYWIQLFNFIYTEKLPANFFITRHLFKKSLNSTVCLPTDQCWVKTGSHKKVEQWGNAAKPLCDEYMRKWK